MVDYEAIYILLLRSIAIGVVLAVTIGLCRGKVAANIRAAGLVAAISVTAYLLTASGLFKLAVEPFYGATFVAFIPAFGVIGFIWLFVLAILDERRPTPATLAPGVLLSLLMLIADSSARHGPLLSKLWLAIGAAFTLHCLYVAASGWRGDLVEARRRLRAPLIVLVAAANLYILWNLGVGLRAGFSITVELINACIETAIAIGVAAVLLEGRGALLASAPQRPAASRADAADRQALAKLEALMEREAAWRREGLTIGQLASEIGVGEQRLRRLINQRLGHRNFASFVNAYRIEAAKTLLADPAAARKTVAEIAFDHGFTSLGPFNRAFKDLVGETPTEWRRRSATA